MLTAAELTVLGLLIERPQHGYDLAQVIEQRGIRQWTDIGFSSIYYLLRKLEHRGLVEAPEQPRGSTSRRVFRATPEGRAAARHTATALIQEPTPVRHPILVGLANLPLLSGADFTAAIRRRRAQLEERLHTIQTARRLQQPLPPPAEAVFSYALCLLEAERTWLDTHIKEARHVAED